MARKKRASLRSIFDRFEALIRTKNLPLDDKDRDLIAKAVLRDIGRDMGRPGVQRGHPKKFDDAVILRTWFALADKAAGAGRVCKKTINADTARKLKCSISRVRAARRPKKGC